MGFNNLFSKVSLCPFEEKAEFLQRMWASWEQKWTITEERDRFSFHKERVLRKTIEGRRKESHKI